MISSSLLLFCLLGAIVGFLAGLLGIGGGALMVPAFISVFGWYGFSPDVLVHIAFGTSLASIVFTAMSSAWAHHRMGAVDWKIFWRFAPGILVGTYGGSVLASVLPPLYLQAAFACFLLYLAYNILHRQKQTTGNRLPGAIWMSLVGVVIGVISGLVGIGGGALIVSFLVWRSIDMRNAISTSAAVGFPLAVSGTIGYIMNGWGHPSLPEYTLGFVYLPALLCIVIISMLTAPLGVRLAHRMPVRTLRIIFALFLIANASKVLIGLL